MIGYWIWVLLGGALVGAFGLKAVNRWVPEANAPQWSWPAAGAAFGAAALTGLVMLPLFGRAGGWILAMAAAAVAMWRIAVPDLVDALEVRVTAAEERPFSQ